MALHGSIRTAVVRGLGVVACLVLSACQVVQPWEKGTLGKDTMTPTGPVPALVGFETHVYYSKEAVHGGTGVGGGGCGCN